MRVSHLATTDQNILLGASRFTTAKRMNSTYIGGYCMLSTGSWLLFVED